MLVLVASGCFSSYSYSEVQFGQTTNAADFGYQWVMQNVLPQQAGLEVTGVIYRYVAVKDPESDMVVYVQNEDAQNEGEYIFREKDDWSGKPGNSIFKLVPVENILIDRWGDGSIEIEGEGTVEDATVVYNYRFDPCFDPQSDPSCPDYVPPIPDIPEPDLTMYDDMNNQFIQDNEDSKKVKMTDEEQEELDRRKQVAQKKRERLEIALGAGENSKLLSDVAQQQYNSLLALGVIPRPYLDTVIDGGIYEDTVILVDGKLPTNPKGRRGFVSQQLLHEKMVNAQYEEK